MSAARTARWVAIAAGALGVAACGGLLSGNAEDRQWLRDVGFAQRADWPSAVLHWGEDRLRGWARLGLILEQAPGVVLSAPVGEDWGVARTLPAGGSCSLPIVLNGTVVARQRSGGDWTVDFLARPRDLLGVEVHFGEEGPMLDPAGCGSVLIWTRLRSVVTDGSFRGDVVGSFWGSGDVGSEVTSVSLEPGGAEGSFSPRGDFEVYDVLPGPYHVVVRAGADELGRHPVRIYAYARSRVEVALGAEPPAASESAPSPPSQWLGCYAFRSLRWSRPLEDWAVPLHTPPDTFRLLSERGDSSFALESERRLARPRMERPAWGGWPAATWEEHGDSATVVWTNGFTGAVLTLRPEPDGYRGSVRWISDVDAKAPEGAAALDRIVCARPTP